jgi:hypothetical protein
MKTVVVRLVCGVFVFTLLNWLGTARELDRPAEAAPRSYLDQGWTEEQRLLFYTNPQGSYLLPYEWFLHLEQPGADKPFRSEEYMEPFRYLPNRNEKTNPDGLPVGFVKESPPVGPDGERNETVLMRPFMGPNAKASDFPKPQAWLGLTCAACHTTASLTDRGPGSRGRASAGRNWAPA